MLQGRYEILTSISEECPYQKCDGTGQYLVKDWKESREFMNPCPCRSDNAVKKKLLKARIPEEFVQATISSFDISLYKKQKEKERAAIAKRASANFVQNFNQMQEQGKGLYLYSETKGSGKTRLMASIINALTAVYDKPGETLSILFSPTIDLLDDIKKTFSDDSKVKTSDLIETIKNVDILALDDIGVEKVTSFVEEKFSGIMDYRLTNKKVTLFTSNLSIDDLDIKYKEGRVSSRIEKMAFPIYMPDEKIRSYLAQQENEDLQSLLYK